MVARESFSWMTALAAGGLALGVAGVVATVASRSTRAASPRILVPRRIALIGDSYAVGLGPELAKLLPQFKYEGHEGSNVSQWAARAPACTQEDAHFGASPGIAASCGDWLETYQPNLTLVALGVNDGNAPNSANYHTIVSAIHGIGSKVVWIEPPAGVGYPAVRGAIGSLGVQTIAGAKLALRPDGVHPQNYATWARDIAQAIG